MSKLILPTIPRGIMFIEETMTIEWQNFFRDLFIRTGKYDAPTNLELGELQICSYASDDVERTTANLAYVWEDNLDVGIDVKIGNIIMISLDGWYKNKSDGEQIGFIDLYSGNANRLIDISYLRSKSRFYLPVSISTLYKANTDGILHFRMKFKSENGQTVYTKNRSMKAWVVGKE